MRVGGQEEPSAEQRAQDRHLAWLIVAASATVTLTIAALLLPKVYREWVRSLQLNMERAERDANPFRPPATPPPAHTAKPSEDWRSWLSSSNRPAAALARGEHGTVRVTLAIDPAGKPTGCAVAESSGFWALDNGTCLALMRAGRFAPATPREPGGGVGEVRRWTSPAITWNTDPGS